LPNTVCLLGNHDAAVLGKLDQEAFNHEANISVNWTRDQLSAESIQYLQSLRTRVELLDVTLSHGSPRNPIWEYLLDINTVLANFSFFKTPICLVGHTHIPIMYTNDGNGTVEWSIPANGVKQPINHRSIINPGSVGQPRDRNPQAALAIYYPEEHCWEARRVEYDISSVQGRIAAAGLPSRHAARLEDGW
jgi:diadenosine tetraphosphatase ApaH/serine/threonine PP2A family protein phosphatase